MKKRTLCCSLLMCFVAGLCSCKSEVVPKPEKYPLGTGKKLEGKILIVSVFCNDYERQWDEQNSNDIAAMSDIRNYISVAAEYLESEAARYGKELEIVYDWEKYDDLCYIRNIPIENAYTSLSAGYEVSHSISITIDYEALLTKYNADGIVFYSFHNTPLEYEGSAYAEPHKYSSDATVEIAYIGMAHNEIVTPPLIYAHELLHLFGAYDFYRENSEYGIPQTYVDYIAENSPDEIMFASSGYKPTDRSYETIDEKITEITAYYIGWLEHCDDVEKFGLGRSEHDTQK